MNPQAPLPKALLVAASAVFLSGCPSGSAGQDATPGETRSDTDATALLQDTDEAPFDATARDAGMDRGTDRFAPDDGPLVPSDDRFDLDCRRGAVTTMEVLRPRDRRPALMPPRPVGPLSTMRVASQRPLLRWALPAGVTGARVELCLDCECTSVLYRLDLEGSSGRPPERLPPGVVFWRLLGITEGGVGTIWSHTWEFVVGHRDRGTDAVYGGMKDYNGDGFDDMLFILPAWGRRIEEYHGSSAGPPTVPDRLDLLPSESGIDRCCHSSGDVNRDGFADLVLILSVYSGLDRTGLEGLVYLGSRWGLSPVPMQRFPIPISPDFSVYGSATSDLNGDGFSDLAVSSGQRASELLLFLGSPEGLREAPVRTEIGARPDSYLNLVAVGDFDGDGYGDLSLRGQREMVTLRFGTPSPEMPLRSTTFTSSRERSRDFGGGLRGHADFNADGIQDLIVGEDTTIEVLFGGLDASVSRRYVLERPDMEPGVGFGVTEPIYGGLLALDAEGTGRTQLVISIRHWPYRREISMGRYEPAGFATLIPFAGVVYQFRATGMMLDPVPSFRLQSDLHAGFAASASALGDVNGDGFEDFGIGGDSAGFGGTFDIFFGAGHRGFSAPDVSYVRVGLRGYSMFFNGIE